MPLCQEGAARRQANERHTSKRECEDSDRKCPRGTTEFLDTVMACLLLDDTRCEKQRALCESMRQGHQDQCAKCPITRCTRWHGCKQRKEEKQVTKLCDRGVGRKEFQPDGTQCIPGAPEYSHGTEASEQPGGENGHDIVEDLQPETQQQVESGLDDQRREDGAHGRRCIGVCWRQPEMQRKERRLQQQAADHQRQGDPCDRFRREHLLQFHQIQRAVTGVYQRDAGQEQQ